MADPSELSAPGDSADNPASGDHLDFDFPVWVPFLARGVDRDGDFEADALVRHVSADLPERPEWVPVFTSWDLALRYIIREKPDACAVPVGETHFMHLLLSHDQAGVRHVSFDPGEVAGGTPVRLDTVADVVGWLTRRKA